MIDALAFVRETHGFDSVSRVLEALGDLTGATFRRPIRETEWYPIEVLTSFLMTARTVLEPGATDFYRRQGYYAAQKRKRGSLGIMVDTSERRARMAKVVWHMFYDTGRLEVTGQSPETVAARIHGFPATPELCERFRGIWEGMAGPGTRAEETRCVLRGDPYCELHVVADARE